MIQTLDWIRWNADSAQVVASDGIGATSPSMPELAVQGVVANT